MRQLARMERFEALGVYIAVVACSSDGTVTVSDQELRRFCADNALTIAEIAQEIMGKEWPVA